MFAYHSTDRTTLRTSFAAKYRGSSVVGLIETLTKNNKLFRDTESEGTDLPPDTAGENSDSLPEVEGENFDLLPDTASENSDSNADTIEEDSLPGSPYYAKFVSIVQSSGTGKTKTVVEVSRSETCRGPVCC